MADNELIQRAELLNRINELTTRIAQGAGSLNMSSTQLANFTRNLDLMKQKAQEATTSLTQLQRIVNSIESNAGTRVRVDSGQRVNTSPLITPYQLGGGTQNTPVGTPYEYYKQQRFIPYNQTPREQMLLGSGQTGSRFLLGPGANYSGFSGSSASGGYDQSEFMNSPAAQAFKEWSRRYKQQMDDAFRSIEEGTAPTSVGGGYNGFNNWFKNGGQGNFFPTNGSGGPSTPLNAKPAWWDKAMGKAGQYGFSPDDLQGIRTEASSGNSSIGFEQIDKTTGAMKNLNLTMSSSGEILADTQRRFRSFFSSVGRDTVEFLKWSVAISLVLGPLQKFNELISIAIANESKLADISIALAGGQENMNKVFSAASDIANAAGEEITTVLDAYTLAYRAIGSGVEPTERLTKANKLLADSLILSKLTGLDEAQAIDTLSAALKQAYGADPSSLGRGTELLDKWIRTTQVANVSLDTLATGFAIVGDAADSAGLNIDQLNGLLAAIAETGIGSGKEVANAARAMISGFQSDQAKQALASLGIATESNGETRPFQDILNQVASLKNQGAIGGAQFNDLTLKLGGGSRRQAAWSTLISTSSRVGQVAAESALAGGESQQALAQKTGTVETAVTRLGNAFQVLANTLGSENGLLDDFRILINFATTLVELFDKLSSGVGKALPVALVGLGLGAYAAGKGPTRQSQLSMGGLLSNVFTRQGENEPFDQYGNRQANWTNRFNRNGLATGLTAAALPVLSNLADDSLSTGEKVGKVSADIIGGIVGGIAGGPAGAIIGVTIAEAFSSAVVAEMNKDYSGTYSGLVARLQGKTVDKNNVALTPGQQAVADAEKALGQSKTNINGRGATMYDLLATEGEGNFDTIIKKFNDKYSKEDVAKMSQEVIMDTIIADAPSNMKPALEQMKKAMALRATELQQNTGQIPDATINKFIKENSGTIAEVQGALTDTLFNQYSQGSIGKAGLTRGLGQAKNLQTLGTQWYQSVGQGQDVGKFFEQAGRISAYGSPEDIDAINQYTTDLNKLKAITEDNTKTDQERNLAQDEYNEKLKITRELMSRLNTELLAQKSLTQNIDLSGLSQSQIAGLFTGAIAREAGRFAGEVGTGQMSQAEADAIRSQSAPFLYNTSETDYKLANKGTVGVDFFKEEMDDQIRKGLIPKPGKETSVGFQSYDYTRAEFQKVIDAYPAMANRLTKAGATLNPTGQVSVFSDDSVEFMKYDFNVIQYLLAQILDVNKKQLEGQFNLPEGMSFFLPYQALMAQGKKETTGSGNEVTGPGANPSLVRSNEEIRYQENHDLLRMNQEPYYGEVKGGFGINDPSLLASNNEERYQESHPYPWSGGGTYRPADTNQMQDLSSALSNAQFDVKANLTIQQNIVLSVDGSVFAREVQKYMINNLSMVTRSTTGGGGGGRPVLAS